jgi:hypothetical protein
VQNIINSCPEEVLFWSEIQVTCQGLVQIDEPKSSIENFNESLSIGPDGYDTKHTENNVEDVIRRRATGETLFRRYKKSRDANQNQYRGEDCEDFVI